MSNKYTKVHNRIDLYFTWLPYYYDFDESEEKQITIKWFAEKYNIPISIIRADIVAILMAYSRYDDIYLVIEPLDYESDLENINDVIEEILDGHWDVLPLVSNIPINRGTHSFSLTVEEKKALNEEFKFYSNVIDFEIKKDYRYYTAPVDLYYTLDIINYAIDNRHQIVFYYEPENLRRQNTKLPSKSKVRPIFKQISPVKIIYDNEENLYSILGIENNSFVVYNIDDSIIKSSLKVNPDTHCEPYNQDALDEKIPHVWGNAFAQTDSTHVKVKFSKDVFDSVMDDLVFRNPEKTLSEISDGYFFFEDDIYGVDAFDAWVRTYGCKAVIIEPKSLAKKRIESLKKTLELYANID